MSISLSYEMNAHEELEDPLIARPFFRTAMQRLQNVTSWGRYSGYHLLETHLMDSENNILNRPPQVGDCIKIVFSDKFIRAVICDVKEDVGPDEAIYLIDLRENSLLTCQSSEPQKYPEIFIIHLSVTMRGCVVAASVHGFGKSNANMASIGEMRWRELIEGLVNFRRLDRR